MVVGEGHRSRSTAATGRRLRGTGLVITLLIIWLILTVLGFAVKGLLWLAIIGLILLVATAVWGWVKRRART